MDTTRVSGETPPELSVNVSRLVYPSRQVFWRPRAVILAPETDAAQAAAAVPLIHFPRNAPLLLSAQEMLSLPR